MKTIQDIFFETADSVRAIAAYNRMIRPDVKQFYTPVQYAKEYCTCRIYCGRQSGASSWIRSRARCDDLIITYSLDMANYMKDNGILNGAKVISCQSDLIWKKSASSVHYHTIWVDNSDFVFKKISFDQFMDLLAGAADEFVFVGS